MENHVFTSLSIPELRQIVRQELEGFFAEQPQPQPAPATERPLNVQEAAAFLGLTVPTVYSKASKGELPVAKRGKRLYFQKAELLQYLQQGRRATNDEAEQAAAAFVNGKKGVHNE